MGAQNIEAIIQKILSLNPKADIDLIALAHDFAKEAHKDQTRLLGEPYINHPVAAAYHLANMGLDETIITAALLHDVVEDANIPLKEIEKNFGSEIAQLVSGVTKLGNIKYRGVARYMENLRRMFVAMAQDIRVILIKFADRMHNLETLHALKLEKQKRIAFESLEIYAPIANRLGMGEIKGQIEDLAFPYVYPEEYVWLLHLVKPKIRQREFYCRDLISTVKNLLKQKSMPFYSVHGRTKHLYSLYKKLLKNNKDISVIHDLVALRVIVPTVTDCYAALGIIHNQWKPLKDRIKDFIAQPKPNGYQSLHTTVFCERGEIVEFQIRTSKMHEEAEYGIAAHWHYDESDKKRATKKLPKEKIAWMGQLKMIQQESSSQFEALESMKLELFKNRIFVFTPKGDVIDLPEDATPVDFAYHIHSDIGDRCVAAKVNDKIQSLDRPLQNCDVVEIIINKNRKLPNPDWLSFVKTDAARKHILSVLKKNRKKSFHSLSESPSVARK